MADLYPTRCAFDDVPNWCCWNSQKISESKQIWCILDKTSLLISSSDCYLDLVLILLLIYQNPKESGVFLTRQACLSDCYLDLVLILLLIWQTQPIYKYWGGNAVYFWPAMSFNSSLLLPLMAKMWNIFLDETYNLSSSTSTIFSSLRQIIVVRLSATTQPMSVRKQHCYAALLVWILNLQPIGPNNCQIGSRGILDSCFWISTLKGQILYSSNNNGQPHKKY